MNELNIQLKAIHANFPSVEILDLDSKCPEVFLEGLVPVTVPREFALMTTKEQAQCIYSSYTEDLKDVIIDPACYGIEDTEYFKEVAREIDFDWTV